MTELYEDFKRHNLLTSKPKLNTYIKYYRTAYKADHIAPTAEQSGDQRRGLLAINFHALLQNFRAIKFKTF